MANQSNDLLTKERADTAEAHKWARAAVRKEGTALYRWRWRATAIGITWCVVSAL